MDDCKKLWVLEYDDWTELLFEKESYGDHTIGAGWCLQWLNKVGATYPLIIQKVFEESGLSLPNELVDYIIEHRDLPEEIKNHEWVTVVEPNVVNSVEELIEFLY